MHSNIPDSPGDLIRVLTGVIVMLGPAGVNRSSTSACGGRGGEYQHELDWNVKLTGNGEYTNS